MKRIWKIKQVLLTVILLGVLALFPAHANKSRVEKSGDALLIAIPLSGLATALLYESKKTGTVQLSKSMATTLVIVGGLKVLTRKKRPNGEDYLSFPSGHTATAFTGAGFIHKRYGLKYAIPAYIGASYVGYSRINADKHDVVDVAAGAAIGLLSSYYFTRPYRKNLTVMPFVGDELYGVSLSKRW